MPYVDNQVLQSTPIWLACCLVCGSAQPVFAQTDTPTAAPELTTVTITAKGHSAPTVETPAAVLALDREDLFQLGASSVGDALRGQPGLAVASDGAQGQNPVIRGLKRESIVLLVDGIRLNAAQPVGAIASFMSMGLAEQVEVVKGPASVLYGTGALGGVVNVRLPQAEFTPGIGLKAAAAYDSASQGVRGAAVLNWSQADHALMLGLAPARSQDYRAPGGRVQRTGYDSDSFIGQYRLRIDGQQQLRLSLQQHTDSDVWYPGSTKPGMPALLGKMTTHSPTQRRELAELGYTLDSGDWRLDARAYRQSIYRQIQAHSSGLGRNQVESTVHFDTDGMDLKLDWSGLQDQLVTVGLNSWRMKSSPQRVLHTNAPLFNNGVRNDPFADGQVRAVGLYAQDDMRLGALGIVAGLRHDRVNGRAASINNGSITTGLQRSDSATTGSLGAMLEVQPLLRPYANLSRAFRAADMRERFESSPRGDGYFYVGNPQLRPEQATQFELGIKGEDQQFSYSVSAYRSQISNYITGRVTGAALSGLPVKRTENIGRVTLQGLEAQGRWQVTAGQTASLGYSHIRASNRDLNEPLFQSPADELTVGWDARIDPHWSLDARWRLVARQDRVAKIFSNGSENATPGFGTVDLGVTWRQGPHSLRVMLKNAGNKAYHEHLTEGISGQEIQAPGRSLYLQWKANF